MKKNTAFLYALRIWLCTLIVGSIFAVPWLLFDKFELTWIRAIAELFFLYIYVGVHTIPSFLGLLVVFLALPTMENKSSWQKIIYGILITLIIGLNAYFLFMSSQSSIKIFILIVFAYIIVALAAMLYFYPKGINIDTYKKNQNLLDADL